MDEFTLASWLIYLLIALLNAVGHWFPWATWPGITDGRGQLRRVLAYGYGVGTIVAGYALKTLLWLALDAAEVDVMVALLVLLILVASAGLGTLVPYAIDEVVEHRAMIKDARDYEQTLEG